MRNMKLLLFFPMLLLGPIVYADTLNNTETNSQYLNSENNALSKCEIIVNQAGEYYEPYKTVEYRRKNILTECQKYLDKSCKNNQGCGAFPCVNGVCLIKPCTRDSECRPAFCGLHLTPVPVFCTTSDAM